MWPTPTELLTLYCKLSQIPGLSKPIGFQGTLFWEVLCSNKHCSGYFLDQTRMQLWALFDFCLSTVKMPFTTPVGRKRSCLVKPYEKDKFFTYWNTKTIKVVRRYVIVACPLIFFFLFFWVLCFTYN